MTMTPVAATPVAATSVAAAPTVMAADPRSGRAELARLLLLLTAGMTLLAMLGEIVLMASPAYAAVPVMKAILLMVLARKIVLYRRWAMITTIVLAAMMLAGFSLSSLIGLLPQIDHTVTLTGLITEVALPIVLIVLCGQLLASTPRRRKTRAAR
jgi:hypothetical protein